MGVVSLIVYMCYGRIVFHLQLASEKYYMKMNFRLFRCDFDGSNYVALCCLVSLFSLLGFLLFSCTEFSVLSIREHL